MLAALDLSHVGSLNAGHMSQSLLGHTLLRPCCTHGGAEIGAAWKKTSQADRPYLSVVLDDPTFPTAIYARLLEGEDGEHTLIWSRTKSE